MNTIRTRFFSLLVTVGAVIVTALPLLAMPMAAEAQGYGAAQPIDHLGTFVLQFIYFADTYLVPAVFAIAFIVFIIGVYRFFIYTGADPERRTEGRKFIMWAIIGLFVMISVWGIVNLLVHSIGFGVDQRPGLPTFGSPSSSSGTGFGNRCAQASCPSGTSCNPDTGACVLSGS